MYGGQQFAGTVYNVLSFPNVYFTNNSFYLLYQSNIPEEN